MANTVEKGQEKNDKKIGRTFNFVNSIKGGCGKTTFSVFLANYLYICKIKASEDTFNESSGQKDGKDVQHEDDMQKASNSSTEHDECIIFDMDFQGTSMESLFWGSFEGTAGKPSFKNSYGHKYLNAAIREDGKIDDYIVHNPLTDEIILDVIFADSNVKAKERLRISPKMGYSPVVQYNIFKGGLLKFLNKFKDMGYRHFIFDMPPNSDGFSGAAMECVMNNHVDGAKNFLDRNGIRQKKDIVNLFYVTGIDPGQVKETVKEVMEQLVNRDHMHFDNIFIVMNDNIPMEGDIQGVIKRNSQVINSYFISMLKTAGLTQKEYERVYLLYMEKNPRYSTYCIEGNGLNNIITAKNLANEQTSKEDNSGELESYIPVPPIVTILKLSLIGSKKCRPAPAVLREMPGAKSEYFIGV